MATAIFDAAYWLQKKKKHDIGATDESKQSLT